jgi:hypothetical protein
MTLQKLLTTYHKLPEQLKALMRLKALLYFKIPIETWRACFYSLTYLFPTKTPLSISEFNALVDLLKAKKLLDRDSVSPYVRIVVASSKKTEGEEGAKDGTYNCRSERADC